MRKLSARGQEILTGIASRHGFGFAAVSSMLDALIQGNGTMAQFHHPEFGGSGQWMQGGMTMVSDMFNSTLKGRVDGLCSELSSLIAQQPDLIDTSPPEVSHGHWWPAGLGSPNSTGSQNNSRYAYFAENHRLAIEHLGTLTVYDTLDHRISGVSQQQSFGDRLQFTSQHGFVDVASLPIVTSPMEAPANLPLAEPPVTQADVPAPPARVDASAQPSDIFVMIEKLAELRQKGILTESEFSAKKTELLGRI